jgi:hypothetical protein
VQRPIRLFERPDLTSKTLSEDKKPMRRIKIGAELSHKKVELLRLLAHIPESECKSVRRINLARLQCGLQLFIREVRMKGHELFPVWRWHIKEKFLKEYGSIRLGEQDRCQAK